MISSRSAGINLNASIRANVVGNIRSMAFVSCFRPRKNDCVFVTDRKRFTVHLTTDTKAPKPKRLTWSFVLRLIFTAGIFVYLWYSIEWEKMLSLLRESRMAWWLVAMGLYLITTLLGAVRWQILLNTCRAGVPFARTVQMTMIGLFANSFMPSAMGGDLVKAFYIAKEVPHQKATVVMSIFMERLLGLVAMFMISAFLIFSRFFAVF